MWVLEVLGGGGGWSDVEPGLHVAGAGEKCMVREWKVRRRMGGEEDWRVRNGGNGGAE